MRSACPLNCPDSCGFIGTMDGFGVNQLLGGKCSDYGESTSYYEARCQIRKWLVD